MIEYKDNLLNINSANIKLILAPSSIYLPLFKNTNINLCIQDIALNEKLNLTGDISIHQLKSLDVAYAIIGHFERRKYYKETEHEILSKIKDALEQDLKIIYCIGETEEQSMRHVEYLVLEREIAKIFNKLNNEEIKKIIIAYEPEYLIGKNTTHNPEKITNMINFIKTLVKDYYNINIPVIFGGSINKDNINKLLLSKNIDGFIICSSILNPENIIKIIEKMQLQ